MAEILIHNATFLLFYCVAMIDGYYIVDAGTGQIARSGIYDEVCGGDCFNRILILRRCAREAPMGFHQTLPCSIW